MKIPFFDYPRHYLDQKDKILEIVDDVCSRGAFIMQDDLFQFEKDLQTFLNANYCVGVANATDGLEICWQTIGLSDGDEVIVSSHTMLATASAIIMAGGKPVPIDIGDDNLIDASLIEEAINDKTVGIMPTQLNGRTCEMDQILSISEKYDLHLVEDAAQALGSRYQNKCAGTFGVASAFSFFPAKVLGCLGDGGAVVTNDENLFEKIFQMRDHGRDLNGEVKSWGRNSRLDNLNAAILKSNLEIYEKTINRRREVASLYDDMLSGLDELTLPPGPEQNNNNFDVYQNYELKADKRDSLRGYLKENGIGTLIQWGGKGIHQFKNLGFNQKLPKTEEFFERSIMLPMNMFVSNKEIEYICNKIKNFYMT